MANAAFKKAAIARKQAASFYLPFVLIINLLHIVLTYFNDSNGSVFQTSTVIWMCIKWGITYVAYIGILEDAENNASNNNANKKLAGGMYLDLLGLVIFTQYASLYVATRCNWLLVVVPIVYGTKKFWGGGGGDPAGDGDEDGGGAEDDKALSERRRKRAERRKQKRG